MTRAAQHRTATEEPEFVADARPRNVVWEVEPSGEPALLADLERSARVGIAMHSIFQYADFSDLSTLPGVVSSHLASSGVDSKRWSDPVAHAVRVTLDAELRADRATLRLRDIGRGNQLHELDFTLPVCGGLATRENRVGPSAIAEIFRDNPGGSVPDYYADEIAKLPFVDFCGFLSGSIDLVLEHGGQWYLADYKSNHLGANRAHYGRIALLGEMQKAHYVLQYHLYLVALYRWLHIRVPGFDWKTQMGGVFYLFLRGMSSDPGADTGVYYDLPPQARIEALANAIYGSVQVSA